MLEASNKARLRRVNAINGQGVTCFPIMTLKESGITTFGRSSQNDYLLDSNFLKNFISRFHCKVESTKTANGQMEYKIFDSSMNGTFVNDVRLTAEGCVLNPGDKVNFGHLNGFNIKPGTLSKQPKSAFRFTFEFVTENECSTPPKTDTKKYVWKSPCCKSGYECSSKKKRKKKPVMMKTLFSYFQPKSEQNSLKEIKEVNNKQDSETHPDDDDDSPFVCYAFDEASHKIRRLSPPNDENDFRTNRHISRNFLPDSKIEKESNDSEESDATLYEQVFLSVNNFSPHNSDSDIFASDEEGDIL